MKRVAGWVVLAILLIGAGVTVLPLAPVFLAFSIDDSFGATLHHEFATRHTAAGTRLISTYGPLGFVFYSLYFPATFHWLVALQALVGAALCWALAWIGWAAWGSPWGAALAVGLSAPFLAAPDVRFWVLPLLVVLIELLPNRRAPAALRVALGAALGLAALIKVTFFTAAAIVLGPLSASELVRRRMPLTAGAAVLTICAAWLAQGLGGADWLAYLDWSFRELTPGYSAAMQLQSTTGLVAHAVAVSGAMLVAGSLLARQRARHRWWWIAVALAGLLFLLFKAGFVRADEHVFITSFGLLVCGILLAVLWGTAPARLAAGILLVAALPGVLLWHAIAVQGAPTSMLFRAVLPNEMISRLRAVPDMLLGDALAQAHASHAEAMRTAVPMPLASLAGPIDLFSLHQNLLLAYGVEFRPRPVFQSFMAYSARLADANAAFLDSERAPRWILFEPATIDGRFPALDDAAAWPLLFTRYRLAGALGPLALLERRQTALPWRLAPLGGVETSTDARIDVPAGAVWARIDVQQTFSDRLLDTLFTAPYVYMDVTFATGTAWRYRLVPAIARNGFLLSPLIGYPQDVVAFMQQGASAIPARAIRDVRIRVVSPFGQSAGPRTVGVEFFQFLIGDEGEIPHT